MNKFATLSLLITAVALGLVGHRADARPLVVGDAIQQKVATLLPEKFVFGKLPHIVIPPSGPAPDHNTNQPSAPYIVHQILV
ncbi:hypothetical protein ABFS82_13G022800 [Erythranthe guttata]